MYISGQVLLIMLLVGLVAGWLAGQLVKGAGFVSSPISQSGLLVPLLVHGFCPN